MARLGGYALLTLQVVAGQFLLGVLISRVTIAFQAEGPAQDLAKPKGWRRWRKSIIAVGLILLLAAPAKAWYGWAVGRWPAVMQEVQQQASQQPQADPTREVTALWTVRAT